MVSVVGIGILQCHLALHVHSIPGQIVYASEIIFGTYIGILPH